MTGAELITKERQEQIEKHGYTAEHDKQYGNELIQAAESILGSVREWFPFDVFYYNHIMTKPRIEQLAIAGAFIAAHIDKSQN